MYSLYIYIYNKLNYIFIMISRHINKIINDSSVHHIQYNSDRIKLELVFKVGFLYENEYTYGLSHFLEHLMFSDTEKYNFNLFILELNKNNGWVYSYTTFYKTIFILDIPAKYFINFVPIFLNFFTNPVFNNSKIIKEKQVIYRELEKNKDDPIKFCQELGLKYLFKKTRLSKPFVGYKKNINNFNLNIVSNFYKSFYTNKNSFIVIYGGGYKDYFNIIKENFNLRNKSRLIKYKKENFNFDIVKTNSKIINNNWNSSYLGLFYKTVSLYDINKIIVSFIIFLLNYNNRLYYQLRFSDKLIYSFYLKDIYLKDTGYFCIIVNTSKLSFNKIIFIINNYINNLELLYEKELLEYKNEFRVKLIKDSLFDVTDEIVSENLNQINKDNLTKILRKYFKKHISIILN